MGRKKLYSRTQPSTKLVVKRSPDRFTQPTEGLPFPPAMETCGLRAGRVERPGQDGVLSTIDWT